MFRVIGSDVLLESGEEAITVLGDRAQQTRSVALSRKFDARARAARKPRGTRLDLHRFLGLVDADYGGVHLPPLFFELLVKLLLLVFISFSG
jgi:hypothetical protein